MDRGFFCFRRVVRRPVDAENPELFEDLVPNLPSLWLVQPVFQDLLHKRVPIRDGVSILEALGEAASNTEHPVRLTEDVRQASRRMVGNSYRDPSGDTSHLNLAPQRIRDIQECITRAVGSPETQVMGSGRLGFPVVTAADRGSRQRQPDGRFAWGSNECGRPPDSDVHLVVPTTMKPANLRGIVDRSFLCGGQAVPEDIGPAKKQRLIDKLIGQQEDRAAVGA